MPIEMTPEREEKLKALNAPSEEQAKAASKEIQARLADVRAQLEGIAAFAKEQGVSFSFMGAQFTRTRYWEPYHEENFGYTETEDLPSPDDLKWEWWVPSSC